MSENREGSVVTVGFMPLLDCALLVAAHEKGFARQQGLRLRLVREVSWANVRDRVAFGHFDAAHMLGPMVIASNLLAQQGDIPFVAPAALGVGGNAITVSTSLWSRMRKSGAAVGASPAAQAKALRAVVTERIAAGEPPLTFAMVFPFSCHNYQLRDWLAAGGVDADQDIRLIVLPPPLLVEAIRTGQVDGFCVGEPWSSLAVDAGLGTIVAVGSDIWPRAPEKVLGMRADYADKNPVIVAALVRALVTAADWASLPANRRELAAILAEPRYVGAPEAMLHAALNGSLVAELDQPALHRPEFVVLDAAATIPRREDAGMLCARIEACGQAKPADDVRRGAVESFRVDLYRQSIGEPVSEARAIPG
jgi:ABC-type nitrate/sulfonate/bicarbonate transport system substrate-binding protein